MKVVEGMDGPPDLPRGEEEARGARARQAHRAGGPLLLNSSPPHLLSSHLLTSSPLTSQEFWTKFFQSHYFHRDRVHAQGTKDLFTECARDDDRSMKKQLEGGINELVADIENFSDSTLAHGFGGVADPVTNTANQNIVHQNIIKR